MFVSYLIRLSFILLIAGTLGFIFELIRIITTDLGNEY